MRTIARSLRTIASLTLRALAATTLALIAGCGGTNRFFEDDAGNGGCPPGYTCVPDCATGVSCGSPAGTGGYPTYDAGSPSMYDAALPVDSGTYPEGSVPPASATLSILDYRVVDAEYSTALSTIVMVSDSPSNAIHLYDVSTGIDRAIALPVAPVAVSVDVSGKQAAVAYNAHVSWIDLEAGVVKATCDVSSDAYDVALTSQNVAYVMPKTDQWVSIHQVDLTTCTEAANNGYGIYASSHMALHPSEKALFTADSGLSPSSINRCDLATSPLVCSEAQSSWGTYNFCGSLWMSADGARVYSGCGVTLRVPGSVTGDPCTYGGTLEGVAAIVHLSEAPSAKRVAIIPDSNGYNDGNTFDDSDTVVRIHETDYLGFIAQYELPKFPLAGANTTMAHGRFVFASPTLDALYVIVQADGSSGALKDFALAKVVP